MQSIRVIAAMGATLRGPSKLRLTKAQHNPRSGILGPWKKNGIFELSGSETLAFKYGEEFAMDEADGRLNRDLFEIKDESEQEVVTEPLTLNENLNLDAPKEKVGGAA